MTAPLALQIGFLGAGQMARALAAGLVRTGLIEARQVTAYDVLPAALESLCTQVPGAAAAPDPRALATACNVLVLAVKPPQVGQVMADLRPHLGPQHLLVSIAAGIPLAALAAGLPPATRIVRVMPNTPCLVGQSASGYCLGSAATEEDAQLVHRLLSAVGLAARLDEKLLDAVTGLSGSGPAFVYVVIEALADGGVRMGLPRDVALSLAAQTVLGAAQMVRDSHEHPAVLKDRVASPGGTTIAGLQALEAHAVRGALIAAVEAATRRSQELAGQYNGPRPS